MGGMAYFSSTTSTIEILNQGLLYQGNTPDVGGMAYMGGTNNYVNIVNAGKASKCGATQGGCFYMAGTSINKVNMTGGLNGNAEISDVQLSCTSSASCNGGVFYMTGKNQRYTIR
jgi:hypothetical protein